MASSEKIIANEAEITGYIPQRSPMVMVGKLLSVEETRTLTSFLIREDNLFCVDGKFVEAGLIENIAQTAAAGAGYHSLSKNETPPPGFIGGVKNLVIYSLPVIGDLLMTQVSIEHVVFDATVIAGQISINGKPVAECEMKIFPSKPNP